MLAHLTRYPGDYTAQGSATRGDGAARETLALHLINYTGNMYENAAHRVEAVAKLPDLAVRVRVPQGRRVAGVEGIVAGGPLPFTVEQDGGNGSVAVVPLPDIGASESVLVRLGDA